MIHRLHIQPPILIWGCALVVLLVFYLPLMQTIPNGSEHYFMIDVGETQIVLNEWGTLHATGYPFYVVTGAGAVGLLRAFGVSPVIAPTVVSLLWGLLALTLMYGLMLQLTRRAVASAVVVVLFGLTRTFWIHNEIAEIYTLVVALLALLVLLALWQPPIPNRVMWLALVGGIAVGHHRALAVAAPALLFAVFADFVRIIRRRPLMLVMLVVIALIGFVPYLYMMVRAQSGAAWVYGEPGTLAGLWDQFIGTEAGRFIGVPATLDGVIANVRLVTGTIITDVTIPGLLLGVIGLIVGVSRRETRTAALTLLIIGVSAYSFHALLYTDILSALILMVTFSLAFGWLFAVDGLLRLVGEQPMRLNIPRLLAGTAAVVAALVFVGVQVNTNAIFIHGLVNDPTGVQTIALAENAPPGSTLMIAWGARHFAVGFARDVLDLLPGVDLVDHKADYAAILAGETPYNARLVTPSYTFYRQPVDWWREQLHGEVYLSAAAPDLVEVAREPEMLSPDLQPPSLPAAVPVLPVTHRVECLPGWLLIKVAWYAAEQPTSDKSVFVHLLDDAGNVIAQDDHSAPVYGWRPLTTWNAGEIVRDVYRLPRLDRAAEVRYGLYHQLADGSFENVIDIDLPVDCD